MSTVGGQAQAASVLTQALASHAQAPAEDPTRDRILDAAVLEAASVGLARLTVDEVARRAGIGRMTLYRRFAKRSDLMEAMLVRETARFLGAVVDGLASSEDPAERVAGSFVAAMRFVREHPMLKRLAHSDPGGVVDTVGAGDATILRMGTEFLAAQLRVEGGLPPREALWAADVSARLFLTYVALPPSDPDPHDDAQLRAFARSILVPLYSGAATVHA